MLLPQETLEVLRVQVGGQHLDRDRAVQQRLSAPVYDTETSAPDLGDVVESRLAQFRGDVGNQTPLRRVRIDVDHRRSLSSPGRLLSSADTDTLAPIAVGENGMGANARKAVRCPPRA
ncbi:hypothetical protein LAUMK13_00244 [Mycobacterium innocens]|uniref:Uncharacterized protein n=1 Tax=Mycobacterium innocens TaxID=2341083 RepID=A0A498PNV9_9MYCO|nr:hypothetical protein LAUMK13_00244 [Mycobacterium innocens]